MKLQENHKEFTVKCAVAHSVRLCLFEQHSSLIVHITSIVKSGSMTI